MLKIVQITTDNREHSKHYNQPFPYFGAAPEALFQGFSQLNDVEIHVIGCTREPMNSPDELAANIHFHSLVIPKSGWMSSLYYGCSAKIRALCKDIQPDIVHGQGTERECAITAVRCGYPNVVTIHGNVRELYRLGMFGTSLYGPMASWLESHALDRTAGVFCNSEYTRRLVAPRARSTWLAPNAIRSEFFQPTTDAKRCSIPTLVNVGVVGPRKRQLELLRMIRKIVDSGRKMQIVFAGSITDDTEYETVFAAELKTAEAEGYARFVGFLNVQSLVELLDSSHAFLHYPSEEAFGLVVAEAMARGLKFFGANLGGIIDIASGMDGAELHDDFESLQLGICRWLDGGALEPRDLAVEIANRYHPLVIARRHVQIYQEVLGR